MPFCILLLKSTVWRLEFHQRVKAFRTEVLKLQKGQLAHMFGISQSCLSNHENGIREISAEKKKKN